MNTNKLVTHLNGLAFQSDLDKINKVNAEVGGFSGPYVMKVLNLAISCMEDDEYYLEIGCHQGKTLIGGMVGHDKHAIAVDNFSQFGEGTKDKLLANIAKFDLDPRVRFIEMDVTKFFETEAAEPVGVYFYDGNHDTDQGLKGLRDAVPFLAREAVIILDDFSGHGVWRSVQQFMDIYPTETALLFSMRTNNFPNAHPMWWNGMVVISWKADRNPASGV